MSDKPYRPLSRRVQARVMRAANVPMRDAQPPGAHPARKRLMLAYVVGRRSGRIYRQPLS